MRAKGKKGVGRGEREMKEGERGKGKVGREKGSGVRDLFFFFVWGSEK